MSLLSLTYVVPWILALIFTFDWMALRSFERNQLILPGIVGGVGTVIVAIFDLTTGAYVHSFYSLIWILGPLGILGMIGLISTRFYEEPAEAVLKLLFAIMLVLTGVIGALTPYFGSPAHDQIFDSLEEEDHNTDDLPELVLTSQSDVRVLTFHLAQQLIQRGYGDKAASLDTDEFTLGTYTDPSLVNDSFVWVNAPRYEAFKWFGKDVPFFVYTVNDVDEITSEEAQVTHKDDTELTTHWNRISFGDRLKQIAFEDYSFTGKIIQSRFTLDDDLNPYWVLYIASIKMNGFPYLKEIIVVDATDMDNHQVYDLESDDIPDWLEVVYPNRYVEHWVDYWAKWRFGLSHRLFDKSNLYTLDDEARFLVLRNDTGAPTTYWYVPLRQADSEVMGGYVLVNTRTGESIFYNREDLNFASLVTARDQASRFLSSGETGVFRQLTIEEGLLYPIEMDDGSVREAYIFPMFSGLRLDSYTIVDAIQFTRTPVYHQDLQTVLAIYRSTDFEGNESTTGLVWTNITIDSAYADDDEVVFVSNGTTYVVVEDDLEKGLVAEGPDEWRELRLAVSEFERGEIVSIDVTVSLGGLIVDVDWAGSDLVDHT